MGTLSIAKQRQSIDTLAAMFSMAPNKVNILKAGQLRCRQMATILPSCCCSIAIKRSRIEKSVTPSVTKNKSLFAEACTSKMLRPSPKKNMTCLDKSSKDKACIISSIIRSVEDVVFAAMSTTRCDFDLPGGNRTMKLCPVVNRS